MMSSIHIAIRRFLYRWKITIQLPCFEYWLAGSLGTNLITGYLAHPRSDKLIRIQAPDDDSPPDDDSLPGWSVLPAYR